MNTAQPALFYLCPVILILSIATALIRRDLKSYWSGTPIKKMRENINLENEASANNLNANGNDDASN